MSVIPDRSAMVFKHEHDFLSGVRDIMKAKGMSMRELAELVGAGEQLLHEKFLNPGTFTMTEIRHLGIALELVFDYDVKPKADEQKNKELAAILNEYANHVDAKLTE